MITFLLVIGLLCGLLFLMLIIYVGFRLALLYLEPMIQRIESWLAE